MRKIKFISLLLAGTSALCNNIMEGSDVTVSFHGPHEWISGDFTAKDFFQISPIRREKKIEKSKLNLESLKGMVNSNSIEFYLNFKSEKRIQITEDSQIEEYINNENETIDIGYFFTNRRSSSLKSWIRQHERIMDMKSIIRKYVETYFKEQPPSLVDKKEGEVIRQFAYHLIESLPDSLKKKVTVNQSIINQYVESYFKKNYDSFEVQYLGDYTKKQFAHYLIDCSFKSSMGRLGADRPSIISNDSHDETTFATDNDSHESNGHNETMNLTDGKKYIIPWILVAFLTIVSGGLLIDKFFLRSEKKATNNKARKRGERRNKK